ncbi:MAG TPA: hypothetical protein VM847_09125, partial [Tahibacter sp.]|nr:hypothetical protein [Tahibacter sp.]
MIECAGEIAGAFGSVGNGGLIDCGRRGDECGSPRLAWLSVPHRLRQRLAARRPRDRIEIGFESE